MGVFQTGRIFVQIDRNDYWQCAYVFPKGGADRVRGQGLAHFHDEIAHANPDLAEAAKCIRSWDDVKLLSVTLDRLTRWYAPGILAIGDAAHAMRSEEHTSELQSLMRISYAVFCLKKKKQKKYN